MWNSLVTAFSFFTVIKSPSRDFDKKNIRYVLLFLPLVGLVIGLIANIIYAFLYNSITSPFLQAIILLIYFAIITGGLHLDGLIDTADGFFSRKDQKKKLKIMHDSRIGAFACIFMSLFLIFKVAILRDLLILDLLSPALILIPIISRIFMGLMAYTSTYATDKGLAYTFKEALNPKHKTIFIVEIIVLFVLAFVTGVLSLLFIILLTAIYFFLFSIFAKKSFGGITGDLLGAFLETSELLMFLGLIMVFNL